MSVTEQVRPQSENASQYVNYDEFIDIKLKKAKAGIHQADLLTGLILLGVGITTYLLLFAIADQWVLADGFSAGARITLTVLFFLGSIGWLGWKVIWPAMRQVNALYAAREIERAHPELKSGLMSWVDFRQTGRPVPSSIRSSLEKRTATQISKSSVDDAIDRRLLLRSAYLLLGLVVLFCLYTLFSPKRMSTTLWRALMPFSAVSAATRTEIRDVKPGDTEVLARDQIDVQVELAGHLPEEVTLFFSTADRRFVNEPQVMRRVDQQQLLFQSRLTGDAGKGLLSDVTYHIVAGDAKSRAFEIRVNQPPTAEVTGIQYDYPQYMGLPRSTQQATAIDAWEGTWVTVIAKPNMPVKRAMLYCSDQETIRETAEAYPMQVQDDRLTARWQLKFRDDGTFARYFHVQVWNERNQNDPQPTIHRIKIRPDLKPEVAIVHPERDLTVPANTVVPIGITARDPDFLLRRVTLKRELNGEELPPVSLFTAPPEMAEFQTIHRLDLSQLNVKSGDRLSFFVEGEDNFEPFGKRQKNIARSPKITLTIASPAPPEEKKRIEEQQAEELQNKLQPAEDPQRQRDPNAPPEQKREMPRDQQQQDQQQNPNQQQKPQRDQGTGDESMQNGQEQSPGEGGKSGQGTPQQQPGSKGGSDSNGMPNEKSDGMSGEDSQQQPNGNQPNGEQSKGEPSKGESGEKGEPGQSGNSPMNGDQSGQRQGTSSSEKGSSSGSNSEGKNQKGDGTSSQRSDKVGEDQALQKLLDWSREQEAKKQQEQSQQEKNGQQEKSGGEQSGSPSDPQQNRPQPPGDGKNSQDGQSQDGQSGEGMKKEPSDSNGQSGQEKTGQDSAGKNDTAKNVGQKPGETRGKEGEPSSGGSMDSMPPQPNSDQKKPGDSPSDQNGSKNDNGTPGEGSGERGQEKNGDNKPGSGQQPGGENAPGQTGQREQGSSSSEGMKPGDSQSGQSGQPGQMNKPGENGSPQSGDSKGQPGESSDQMKGQENGGSPPMNPNGQTSDSQGAGQQSSGEKGSGEKSPEGKGTEQPGEKSPSESGQSGTSQNGDSKPSDGTPMKPGDSPREGMSQPNQSQPGQSQPNQSPSGQGEQGSEGKPGQSGQGQSERSESGSSPNQQPNQKPQQGEKGSSGGMQGNPEQGQNQQGQSDQNQPGKGESGQGEQGQNQQGESGQGKGQSSGSDSSSGNQSGDGAMPGKAGSSNTQSPGSQFIGEGNNQAPSSDNSGGPGNSDLLTPEQADLANRKKATELALKRLKEQMERGQTPENLMKELGYTPEDLDKFMNRLEDRLADPGIDKSAETESARRQFESLLKGLSTESARQHRGGGDHERRATQSSGSGNRPIPPEYRRPTEAYRQNLSK